VAYAKVQAGYDDGDKFIVADHVDKLLEIQVLGAKEMETVHGPGTAVNATILDVAEGKVYNDQLLFQSQLVASLRGTIGQTVLAYLRVGLAKPGKSAPYILIDASEDADALAAVNGAKSAPAITASAAAASDDPEVEQAVAALGELLQ
jgi:hypothetical protein